MIGLRQMVLVIGKIRFQLIYFNIFTKSSVFQIFILYFLRRANIRGAVGLIATFKGKQRKRKKARKIPNSRVCLHDLREDDFTVLMGR